MVILKDGYSKRVKYVKSKEYLYSVLFGGLQEEYMIKRSCYTCQCVIECDDTPIRLTNSIGGLERVVVPKFNAPLVCQDCRKDPEKLRTARKAMMKYMEWKDTHVSAVPVREL